MAKQVAVKAPKPAFSEKGYVSSMVPDGTFSQWEMFERVPDL